MRRIQLVQWAKCLHTLFSAALLAGCEDGWDANDIDASELELHEQNPPDSPGHREDDLRAQGKPRIDANVGPADIEGRYIVRLKPGSDPYAAADAVRANPGHIYEDVMPGFAGRLDPAQLEALALRADVELIEPDQIVTTTDYQTMDSSGDPWGLDRTDQRKLPLNRKYYHPGPAADVRVYVIDTGIDTDHREFDDADAMAVYDAFGGNGQDCNGHGTHVAGTIAGETYGVAKGARLRAVRVLGCNGQGTWSGVIAGMDWVARNHIGRAVANLSFSGPRSQAAVDAVNRLTAAGVLVVVSAGNSNASACNYSPSNSAKALKVAATDRNDYRASFSNYGSCVSLYAPGVKIESAWLNNSTRTASGTSMAAPHVTGVAALYLQTHGKQSPSTVKAALLDLATDNVVKNNRSKTANRLLYQDF